MFSFLHHVPLVPDGRPPYRQYAGLAFVILTYVGGIIGWSCAVQRVDPSSPPDGAAQVQAVSAGDKSQAAAAPAAVGLWSFQERPSPSGRALDRRFPCRLSCYPTRP